MDGLASTPPNVALARMRISTAIAAVSLAMTVKGVPRAETSAWTTGHIRVSRTDSRDRLRARREGGLDIGILVGTADDPEIGGRVTAADSVLDSTEEVESFLDRLAR